MHILPITRKTPFILRQEKSYGVHKVYLEFEVTISLFKIKWYYKMLVLVTYSFKDTMIQYTRDINDKLRFEFQTYYIMILDNA